MSELARSFNDVAEAYDFGRPRYDDHAIDAIAAAAGGGPRLLDVAAGTGRLSAPLLEKGFDVVAVEPLDEMRAILHAAHRPRPRAGRDRGGAAAARRERRRRRLQRRLALVRRRPRRRRARARRQAWRRRGRVRHASALGRQRRRARLVARSPGGPHGTAQERPPGYSSPARDDPTASRVIRPSRRSQTARRVLRAPHGPRRASSRTGHRCPSSRRCPTVSAPTFLSELDGMLDRRGVDAVDIPYRAELWITRRRPAPAPRADPRAAAS